jgi:hypothetical protein
VSLFLTRPSVLDRRTDMPRPRALACPHSFTCLRTLFPSLFLNHIFAHLLRLFDTLVLPLLSLLHVSRRIPLQVALLAHLSDGLNLHQHLCCLYPCSRCRPLLTTKQINRISPFPGHISRKSERILKARMQRLLFQRLVSLPVPVQQLATKSAHRVLMARQIATTDVFLQ